MKTDLRLHFASPADREAIYRIRHAVYASELGQHAENGKRTLIDRLDAFNEYVVASLNGKVAGFISITPPAGEGYSIDKYVDRRRLRVPFDSGLYELRLLTVQPEWRSSWMAAYLMYAGFRLIAERGGTHIVAMGRVGGTVGLYEKVGFHTCGITVQSGAVTYDIMSASTDEVREAIRRFDFVVRRLPREVAWDLPFPKDDGEACYHGGASIKLVGDEFDDLSRADGIVSADVLDAWFSPAPDVIDAVASALPYLLRTSPPTDCSGFLRKVARERDIPFPALVPGAGSSDLIFRAFPSLVKPGSRVLLLDPTYGEYIFVTERVPGCSVDRIALDPDDDFRFDPSDWSDRFRHYDLVIIVNPNSPTGQFVDSNDLLRAIQEAPSTLFWIDETYIDYVGREHSLERTAAELDHLVVCKSMSKAYALSGARVAYLSTHPELAGRLRSITPPWIVGHLAQLAAVKALESHSYYDSRYAETHLFRQRLAGDLKEVPGIASVLEGVANFLLVRLGDDAPDARSVQADCRREGVFIRALGNMSKRADNRTLRIAVKDPEGNRRIVKAVRSAMATPAEATPP